MVLFDNCMLSLQVYLALGVLAKICQRGRLLVPWFYDWLNFGKTWFYTDVEQDVVTSSSTVMTVQLLCVFQPDVEADVMTSWSVYSKRCCWLSLDRFNLI